MTRDEYLTRSREFAARGEDLPHAKLTASDVAKIRAVVAERAAIRDRLKMMTNKHLADEHGVTVACIEHIASYRTWGHV